MSKMPGHPADRPRRCPHAGHYLDNIQRNGPRDLYRAGISPPVFGGDAGARHDNTAICLRRIRPFFFRLRVNTAADCRRLTFCHCHPKHIRYAKGQTTHSGIGMVRRSYITHYRVRRLSSGNMDLAKWCTAHVAIKAHIGHGTNPTARHVYDMMSGSGT